MGRRLDQLNLGDSGPGGRDDLAASRRAVEALRERVGDMLESGEYDFAWGFLHDLHCTLEKADHVTTAQVEAVNNVQRGQEKHAEQLERWERHERRTGRRYEGFDDRLK